MKPSHKVPETRASNNIVFGKNTHTVKLWLGIRLSWPVASDDLELVEGLREREKGKVSEERRKEKKDGQTRTIVKTKKKKEKVQSK
jgi:hypothetical protein